MENLTIEGTPKTPTIILNAEERELLIKGRSIPENSIEFYKPLVNALEQCAREESGGLTVNVILEYFNTSSSKCLLDIFKKLEKINSNKSGPVSINWYYEEDDEDMLEAGEDYQAIINIPFSMKEIEEA